MQAFRPLMALLDVDLGLGSRLRLFGKAVTDPALAADVQRSLSAIRASGFAQGHPEAIDTLFPMGTTARADLEGLAALRRQIPEVLQQQRRQPLSDAPRGAVPLPPLPDAAEVLSSLVALATDREKQASLREETKDLLRRTPKGLETPKYAVVRTLDGPGTLGAAELRAYEPFTVARTSMRGSGAGAAGEGFNTLAAYLFGKNERAQSMAMTMPVQTAMRDADGACAQPSSMAFVLPARFADAPPAPLASSGVRIDTVPARLVAVQAFAGLATDEEVQRQRAQLLRALADASLAPADGAELILLQYNSPLTVPWRRRNEVALEVAGGIAAARAAAAAGAAAIVGGAAPDSEPAGGVAATAVASAGASAPLAARPSQDESDEL